MRATVEQQRRELYEAEREALEEYRLFLETSPIPHDGMPAATFFTQRNELRTNLKRAETARKLFDDMQPIPTHRYLEEVSGIDRDGPAFLQVNQGI
jgi:hypothetical protein